MLIKFISVTLLIFLPVYIQAKEVEGVKFPDSIKCAGKEVKLQGVCLRTATWMKIKAFVMAYYAENPISKDNDPHLDQLPSCFHAVYLRDIDEDRVRDGWDYLYKNSSMYPYPKLQEDLGLIKNIFGPIKGERTINFELGPDHVTRAFQNGREVGQFKNQDFQKNFVSLWFGSKPPTEVCKNGLMNR